MTMLLHDLQIYRKMFLCVNQRTLCSNAEDLQTYSGITYCAQKLAQPYTTCIHKTLAGMILSLKQILLT